MATDNKYASVYDRMVNSGVIGNQDNQVVGGFGAPDNPDGTPSVQPAQPVQKVANSVYDLYGQNKMNDYSSGIQKKKATSPQKAALPSVGQAPRPSNGGGGDIVTIDPIEEEPIDEGSDYTPPDSGGSSGGIGGLPKGTDGFGGQTPEAPAAPNIPLMPEIPTNGGGGGGAGGGGGIDYSKGFEEPWDPWPPPSSGGESGGRSGGGGGGGGYGWPTGVSTSDPKETGSGGEGGGGNPAKDYTKYPLKDVPPGVDNPYTGSAGGYSGDFIYDPETGDVVIDPTTGLPAFAGANDSVAVDPFNDFKPTGQIGSSPFDDGSGYAPISGDGSGDAGGETGGWVGGYPDSPWGLGNDGSGDAGGEAGDGSGDAGGETGGVYDAPPEPGDRKVDENGIELEYSDAVGFIPAGWYPVKSVYEIAFGGEK